MIASALHCSERLNAILNVKVEFSILQNLGYHLFGSDLEGMKYVMLPSEIRIYTVHSAQIVSKINLISFSNAVCKKNLEIVAKLLQFLYGF